MKEKSHRSSLLMKNVIASFLVKGWSALVVLMMVSVTLKCLGTYQNGVWLTISSLLVWIDQMDIGLGNGLRNRLAVHMAHGEMEEARKIVSSTVAMLCCIMIPTLLILALLVWQTDIYSFLNVSPDVIPGLRIALLSAIVLVCGTFVLKFIGNVYMGMQLPAINNLLIALGQTFALITTWIVYTTGQATFFNIVIINTAAPLIVYLLAYPITFQFRFPQLRPAYRLVNLKSALELGNLGLKFFWIQAASVIQFMTANLLISNFHSPEMVTPYQIAFRYLSLPTVLFTIICTPFWNATTDAYEKNDMNWIRRANQKMNIIMVGMALLILLMVLVSEWVFKIWIGDSCHVPFNMTCMVALYIFLFILSMRYSIFLNGVGALRLQMYMTVMAVIFIPMSYLVNKYTHNILWFLAVMSFCVIPSIITNFVQFRKILNGTANGNWRI
ncbi:MAG: hypothetical protein IJ540_03255 [Prevotella sp.]|nr:hypothetical protein [Prevotella sp.]